MQEFFGIDVGGTAVKWAVLGEDFSIRERGSLPTGFTTAEETVSALIGLVEPYRERVNAVGVSAPGGIYEGDVTGTIHRGGALTFMDGCPLGKLMREALGVPVAVNNDGKCCALGEYAAGALRGTRFGVVLAIGTGIGGGLVIDGKMVHGLVHPEMGHMLLAPQEGDSMPDGVCPYHRHCLEGLASGPAIEKRWGLSAKLMTEDHPAWELEATYLAQMCVNMIVTVSPEVIVLGGGVMQQMHLFPKIRERVLKLLGGYVSSPSITPEGIDSYIVPPALGINSGVIGALLLGAQALEKEGER